MFVSRGCKPRDIMLASPEIQVIHSYKDLRVRRPARVDKPRSFIVGRDVAMNEISSHRRQTSLRFKRAETMRIPSKRNRPVAGAILTNKRFMIGWRRSLPQSFL